MIQLVLLVFIVSGVTSKVLDAKPFWEKLEENWELHRAAANSVLGKNSRKLNSDRQTSVFRWLNEKQNDRGSSPTRLLAEDHYYRIGSSDELYKAKQEGRMLQSNGDQACEEEKGRLESLPEYQGFECSCNPTQLGGVRLRCIPVCGEFCNNEGLVCGKEQVVKIFQPSGAVQVIGEAFEYTRGRSQFMVLERYDCTIDRQGVEHCTGDCALLVNNDRACNSCTLQTCEDGRQEAFVDCENFGAGAAFDFCQDEFNVADGMFEYLSTGEFNECVDPLASAKAACEADAQFFQSSSTERDFTCLCEENSLDAVSLSCTDSCGEYCSTDDAVCGVHVYDQVYSIAGDVDVIAENFHYTKGRDERVTLVKRDCTKNNEDDASDYVCASCVFYVDLFRQCNSCSMQTCVTDDGSQFQAPFLDCDNIETGAVFDLCEQSSLLVEDGLFGYLSSDEFNVCVDNSPDNDSCLNAKTLPADGEVVVGSTANAFLEDVESCGGVSSSSGLWYKVEGHGLGILASTCSPETEGFDTMLTVYGGSCEQLECIAVNDDNQECTPGQSSVTWFGEANQVYYIRVHGYLDYTGKFGLSISETDLALEVCEAASALYEKSANPISGTSCSCEEAGNLAQVMTCSDGCSYCNGDKTVCARKTFGGTFDELSAFHTNRISYEYTVGRSETIVLEESSCTSLTNCEECRVTIDDNECRACGFVDCVDESGAVIGRGKNVDCSNVESDAKYNTCDEGLSFENGLFEALFGEHFERCTREPIEVCEVVASRQEKTNSDEGTKCECAEEEQAARISCLQANCTYCNDDSSVCASKTTGRIFEGDSGFISGSFEEYRYIKGRTETLRVEEAKDGCFASVDGTQCNSCKSILCTDQYGTFDGMEIDCGNIVEGATYNNCDSSLVIKDGLFQVFSHLEFDECLQERDPLEVCLELKEKEESKGKDREQGTQCSCSENAEISGQTLTCSHSDCLYCNYDASVCAINAFGSQIGDFGRVVSTFQGYKYVEGGRSEEVLYKGFKGGCNVAVDGTVCTSCEKITCDGGNFNVDGPGIQVSCDNVPGAASFNNCDDVFVDTGVFEVFSHLEFNSCIKARSSEEVCLEAKESIEADRNDVTCECKENEHGGHTKHCVESGCLYCNSERTVCGHQTFGKKYNRLGDDIGGYNGFQYLEGRSEHVMMEPVMVPGDERDCLVSVNGEECTSCEIVDCGMYSGIDVKCENLVDGGSFNECARTVVDSGVLEFASAMEFDDCIVPRDPSDFCDQQKQILEATQSSHGTVCRCQDGDHGTILTCADTTCQFCNDDGTTCQVDVAYGGVIGNFGFFVSNFQTFDYILGREERVLLEQVRADNSCSFSVDGRKCQSCDVVECADTTRRFNIQCENDTYLGCGELGGGLFEVLTDSSYEVCQKYEGTFPPTPTPEVSEEHNPASGEGDKSSSDSAGTSTGLAESSSTKPSFVFSILLSQLFGFLFC